MPTFKEFLGIKPKQPKQETRQLTHRYGTSPEDVAAEKAEIEESRRKTREKAKQEGEAEKEKARQKFQSEKPQLEWRLGKIPAEIEEQERVLAELKGPEMRKILDKEFELNSALSPMSSEDPNKRVEYEEWVRALHGSRAATRELKADLGRRIDKYQKEINGLEKEKRDIGDKIQRGY